jgi:hypothetical protein
MRHLSLVNCFLSLFLLLSFSCALPNQSSAGIEDGLNHHGFTSTEHLTSEMISRIEKYLAINTFADIPEEIELPVFSESKQATPHVCPIKYYTGQTIWIYKMSGLYCYEYKYNVWICSAPGCTVAGLSYTGERRL